MKVDGKPWRPIWLEDDGWSVGIIHQTRLPFAFASARLSRAAQPLQAHPATRGRRAALRLGPSPPRLRTAMGGCGWAVPVGRRNRLRGLP